MSQLPITKNITMYQGGKWTITLKLSDSNGSAFSLTDYSAKMEIRYDENSEVLKALTVGSGITITAGTGEIKLELTSTETAALKFKRAKYDLFIRNTVTAGNDVPILSGDVTVTRKVTQWTS